MELPLLFKKIKRYGLWFKIILFLGVFSTLGGVSSSLWFFKHRLEIAKHIEVYTSELNIVNTLESSLLRLRHHNSESYEDYFVRRRTFEDLKSQVAYSTIEKLGTIDPETYKFSDSSLDTFLTANKRQLESLNRDLITKFEMFDDAARSAIVFGFLTLFLGIIMPLVLIALIAKLSAKAKTQVERQLSKSIAQWVQSKESYGEQAFKNPKFWAEISLVLVENLNIYWSSPASTVLNELAPIIRSEISKTNQEIQSQSKVA